MKKLLALLISLAALVAFAADTIPQTGFYVDLYGNVFKDGVNTNRQVADYARDPANFSDGPALDAAVRDTALRGRERIASDTKAAQDSAAAQIAAAKRVSDDAIAANAAALAAAQAAVNGKDAELATKAARIAALERYVAELGVYIAGLRGQIAGAGGTSQPPPAAP